MYMLNHYQYHQITTSSYSTWSKQLSTPCDWPTTVQCGRMAYPSSANIYIYIIIGNAVYGSYLISIK